MTDIVIGHCALNIRRPPGSAPPWLGDDDQKAFASRVQGIVLPMLEEILSPMLPVTDGVFPDLAIALDLNARDLAGAAPLARPALRARLSLAVETAIDQARQREPAAPAARPDAEFTGAVPRAKPRYPEPAGRRVHAGRVFRLLQKIFGAGANRAPILLIPDGALIKLLAEVMDHFGDGAIAPRPDRPVPAVTQAAMRAKLASADRQKVLAILADLTHSLDDAHPISEDSAAGRPDRAKTLRRGRSLLGRILIDAGEAHAVSKDRQGPLGSADARQDDAQTEAANAATAPIPARAGIAGNQMNSAPLDPGPGRYTLDHALPFLALAGLSRYRIGEALGLDFEAPGAASVLGAAIALKCLPPDVARGSGAWPESARRSAALAAGQADAPDGAAFARAAGAATGNGALSRAALAAALTGSLQPSATLPLAATGTGLTLFDAGGLFPVANGPAMDLLPLLLALDRTLFLAPADSTLWPLLQNAGLAVVAAGPAVKGENAVAVAGPGGWRGHATDVVKLSAGLRGVLPAEAVRAHRAADVWHALSQGTALTATADPPTALAAYDGLAALLAGFALADIGWALAQRDVVNWVQPDPLLVRDRFADLSGRLDVTHDRLTVHLPLGRRFFDLRDAGLLDTQPGLPWWNGRPIAFTGG